MKKTRFKNKITTVLRSVFLPTNLHTDYNVKTE